MVTYSERDIYSSFEGDICIDGKGDLRIGTSLETYKSSANFVLRTDYGEYQPDRDVGCNLGHFIGEPNTSRTHESMESNINRSLKGEIFSESDVSATVVPFDTNEALAIVNLAGYFLIDGKITYVEEDRLMYQFPYIEGRITPLTI